MTEIKFSGYRVKPDGSVDEEVSDPRVPFVAAGDEYFVLLTSEGSLILTGETERDLDDRAEIRSCRSAAILALSSLYSGVCRNLILSADE